MSTIQPISGSGFRQFTKSEAVAIMEAKHSNVREIVKDQLELLSSRIEQNAKDIRQLLSTDSDRNLRSLVDKNAENIKLLDSNIKSIDQNIRAVVAGT